MATKTENKKPVNTEVGIIGQMYEERKPNKDGVRKIGVIESRETKFRTLMMRDRDGNSFNITYSTFHSNWRKYTGDEIVQTSTQIEEERTEEKKKEVHNKKVVENKQKSVRLSSEDKVKIVRATEGIVESRIQQSGLDLKVSRNCKGGVIVRYKKIVLFEVWNKHALNAYDLFFRGVVADNSGTTAKEVADNVGAELTVHEDWTLKYGYRVDQTKIDSIIDAFIEMAKNYIATKETKTTEEE